MPRSPGRLSFAAAILLLGLNLRPTLAVIGPLLDPIQHDTGLSDTAASLLTSLPVLLMGLCLLGTARLRALLGDRLGVGLGLAAIALASLARWQWPGVATLLLTALLSGLGIAVVQALVPAVIRHRAGAGTAAMMGFYSTAIMGGAAIASFAAPRFAAGHGWPAATGIWSLMALAAVALWWGATRDAGAMPPAAMPPRDTLWRRARAWQLLAFFGLGTSAYTLVLAWLPPYYTGLGWTAPAAGALLAAVTVAEVVAGSLVSLGVGRWRDRRPMIFAAIGALLAGLLCLCLAPLPLAWPAAAMMGLGIGALFPLGLIVAMDHGADPAEAARIVGFVQGGGYLLAAVLPFVAGVIRESLSNLAPAWWLMAALCVLLALIAPGLRPGDRLSRS